MIAKKMKCKFCSTPMVDFSTGKEEKRNTCGTCVITRDGFANAYLKQMLSNEQWNHDDCDNSAAACYDIADAMMRARKIK